MVGTDYGSFGYGGGQRSYSFGKGGTLRYTLDTGVIPLADLQIEQCFLRNNPDGTDNIYYRWGAAGADMTLQPGEYSPYLPINNLSILNVRCDGTGILEIFYVGR